MFTWLSDDGLSDEGLSDDVNISSWSDGWSTVQLHCEESPLGNY